jgi:SAM-dependent methyltransferase
MSNDERIRPDRDELARVSMGRLKEGGKDGGRGIIDHSILAGSVFDELVERVKAGEGEHISVLNIGAGDKAVMEREVSDAREGVGQEPFFIIDSPTFRDEKDKEAVLAALRADNLERAVTIEDFAHNLESVPDNFCDYVFAVNLFQHLPTQDIARALQEIVRVLKPGGEAVIVPVLEPVPQEPDVVGNRPGTAISPTVALRLSVPQVDILRLDLQDLPRKVDASIQVRKEEIPFDMFVMAQGGDPERKPWYTPYRAVIKKLAPSSP